MNAYWHWLCNIEEWGAVRLNLVLKRYGSAEKLFYIEGDELREAFSWVGPALAERWDRSKAEWGRREEEYGRMKAGGIRLVPVISAEYPDRLKEIYGRPAALYVLGTLPAQGIPTAAVVGARACSLYGKQTALELSKKLAEAGIQIISGMASGIDSTAHTGALKAGKETWAVLGTGVDLCYPAGSRDIYEKIKNKGGLISEYSPGTRGRAENFPMRNRIISGMADCIVIIEARKKSGSLITANYALEQGREVFALPGRVGDVLSEGCNRLIRAGAPPILGPEDIQDFFQIQNNNICKKTEKKKIGLEKQDEMLYSCLDSEPKHLERILQETGLPAGQAMETILRLEFLGLIAQPLKNYYVKA